MFASAARADPHAAAWARQRDSASAGCGQAQPFACAARKPLTVVRHHVGVAVTNLQGIMVDKNLQLLQQRARPRGAARPRADAAARPSNMHPGPHAIERAILERATPDTDLTRTLAQAYRHLAPATAAPQPTVGRALLPYADPPAFAYAQVTEENKPARCATLSEGFLRAGPLPPASAAAPGTGAPSRWPRSPTPSDPASISLGG